MKALCRDCNMLATQVPSFIFVKSADSGVANLNVEQNKDTRTRAGRMKRMYGEKLVD